MANRWSPRKAAIVTAVIVFLVVLVGGAVVAALDSDMKDPEKSGEKVGRALVPVVILAGVIAYFVQKSRKAEDDK